MDEEVAVKESMEMTWSRGGSQRADTLNWTKARSETELVGTWTETT